MSKNIKLFLSAISIIGIVTVLSFYSTNIWNDKREVIKEAKILKIDSSMTVEEFMNQNKIPHQLSTRIFGKNWKNIHNKPINSLSLTIKQLSQRAHKQIALFEENSSKNWFKIPLKFALWLSFMFIIFKLLRNKQLTAQKRLWLYLAGTILFGVILGADPSPMGTVKDAIVLYGRKHVIFKPRMVALVIFLLTVFLTNKMICAWGCQFGLIQDFLFRLNRNSRDSKGIIRQYKIPFKITNTFRIIFFIIFTIIVFLTGIDIVSYIDPFKLFKPQYLALGGSLFLITMLITSLFIYRPWCHLFCPFGLAGWFVEKIAWFRIKVDYDKCSACKACEKACPSNAMAPILYGEKTLPDCFSCGVCIEVCPDDAISLAKGGRTYPSKDHFKLKKK